jgi:hypothetical protein
MRHWQYVASFLSLTLLSPNPTTAQTPDAKPDLGANAALKYWTAFGLLPSLDKDQEKLLERWDKVPFDAAVLKLIDRSRSSRDYLYRGAKLQHCEWSLDYNDGSFLRMPYLPKARTLARLAALHARHEFEQGHWKAGWEDTTALLKFARHLEMEPLAIQQMVGYAIETIAFRAAAPYLPELKSVLPKNASAVLDGLPAGATLQQVALKEKQVSAMWLIQELKEAERRKEGSWQDVWRRVFGAPEEGDASRDLAKSVKTFEQAIKTLEDLLPYFDELAKATALPWKEFDAQYPEFVKKAKAANPMAGFILSLDLAMASERRNQAQMAMFKAALAVIEGGREKLKDIKDPFGNGPFEYRALDKGFELRSSLLFRGQPVILTVGNRKS